MRGLSRFYVHFTILFVVVFTACMTVIHAQPYDDHDLRALLMPNDCEMPCFMGIVPGVTTVGEAVKLLQANGWVTTVEQNGLLNVSWTWSGTEPDFILDSKPGYLVFTAGGQRVSRIILNTAVTLGDVWLMLGIPTGHELGYIANNKAVIFYSLRYENQQVLAAGYSQVCTPSLMFWNPITQLEIGLQRPFLEPDTNSFYVDVRDLKKTIC